MPGEVNIHLQNSRRQNSSRAWMWFLPPLPVAMCLAVSGLILWLFFRTVDLKPQVDETFFFSKHDPQLKADNETAGCWRRRSWW